MSMRLTLATYNIHRCIGQDGRYAPDRTIALLKELDADVIALQEVESRARAGIDLLERIKEVTGFEVLAGPTLIRESGAYGNALLTRGHVAATSRLDLSVQAREPRGAITADVRWGPRSLYVVATHLGLKPFERRIQVLKLLSLFEQRTDRPAALMGDLNEWFLWGRPLRWLRALFGKTPEPPTFPARFPMFALDRIWVSPPVRLQRVSVHRSPLSRLASDHLPLTAVLEL